MLAHVIARLDVLQRGGGVQHGRLGQRLSSRVAGRQRRGDAPQAPGTAQVQSVEMGQQRIAAVGHDGQGEKRLGLAVLEAGQESGGARRGTRPAAAPVASGRPRPGSARGNRPRPVPSPAGTSASLPK